MSGFPFQKWKYPAVDLVSSNWLDLVSLQKVLSRQIEGKISKCEMENLFDHFISSYQHDWQCWLYVQGGGSRLEHDFQGMGI